MARAERHNTTITIRRRDALTTARTAATAEGTRRLAVVAAAAAVQAIATVGGERMEEGQEGVGMPDGRGHLTTPDRGQTVQTDLTVRGQDLRQALVQAVLRLVQADRGLAPLRLTTTTSTTTTTTTITTTHPPLRLFTAVSGTADTVPASAAPMSKITAPPLQPATGRQPGW